MQLVRKSYKFLFSRNLGYNFSLYITQDVIIAIDESLNTACKTLTKQDANYFEVMKQIYKALRNSVVYNPDVQKLISESPLILSNTIEVLKYLKANEQQGFDGLKMLLQFLINLIVNNKFISKVVWDMFKAHLKELFKSNVCLYHTSALVYNIFHNDMVLMGDDTEIIRCIFESYKQNDSNEYLTFLLELYIKNIQLNMSYINYNAEHRMLCLEMMKDIWNKDKTWMTDELLAILSDQFKQKSDCILKTVTDYLKDIEPFEVTLLLELLANVSSDENFVRYLQKDKSLLINCAFLLKSIHSIGKESENNFSVISKLSQLEDSDLEVLQHPIYGFKASIIRVLANLCWKHKANQDQVRNRKITMQFPFLILLFLDERFGLHTTVIGLL